MDPQVSRAGNEKIVLRALCSAGITAAERTAILSRLREYEWREAEHRVIFDALVLCRQISAAALRAELQSATTRLGFPDIDLADYLGEAGAFGVNFSQLNRAVDSLSEKNEAGRHE